MIFRTYKDGWEGTPGAASNRFIIDHSISHYSGLLWGETPVVLVGKEYYLSNIAVQLPEFSFFAKFEAPPSIGPFQSRELVCVWFQNEDFPVISQVNREALEQIDWEATSRAIVYS